MHPMQRAEAPGASPRRRVGEVSTLKKAAQERTHEKLDGRLIDESSIALQARMRTASVEEAKRQLAREARDAQRERDEFARAYIGRYGERLGAADRKPEFDLEQPWSPRKPPELQPPSFAARSRPSSAQPQVSIFMGAHPSYRQPPAHPPYAGHAGGRKVAMRPFKAAVNPIFAYLRSDYRAYKEPPRKGQRRRQQQQQQQQQPHTASVSCCQLVIRVCRLTIIIGIACLEIITWTATIDST